MTDGYADLAGFGGALRRAGMTVGPAAMVDFCRAAVLAGPGELYWCGRLTLVVRRQDLATYDRVYGEYFAGLPPPVRRTTVATARSRTVELHTAEGHSDDQQDGVASTLEVLRRKDFATLSADELSRIAALLASLDLRPPLRTTRRWRRAKHGKPDIRRTVRNALHTAAEPVTRHTRVRRLRPRRMVLLLDVSHSMADYARALILFAHAGARSSTPVEVFCFGTRLTRLTTTLARTTPAHVLDQVAELVLDWDGGTRIGDSLKRFLDRHTHTARGAVVVICSDGLETGDAEMLGEQMARLSRLAHLVAWLNPLSASARYEPLARGMRAALPYVDVFTSGHDLAELERLRDLLAGSLHHRPRQSVPR